jgi:subtilisin-like proprotein convertase family protein
VQHILVRTARRNDPNQVDWFVNGGGHDFNHNYGHGAVDALPAVNLSPLWGGLAPEMMVGSGTISVGVPLPASTSTFTTNTVNIPQNIRIENVEVVLDATRVSELAIVSPSGTRSILANRGGTSQTTYNNWMSSSTAHWDEFSQGNWRIEVNNKSSTAGTFNSWQLRIYGTPIDSAAPNLTTNFEFETQQRLVLDFDENVAPSLTASDLIIENLTTSQTIPIGNLSLQWDHATNNAYVTFLNQPNGILPDGNYRLTIPGGSVTDIWNNAMGVHEYTFFVKAGDATRDGTVNGLDFNILAANFGQSPRTFSQGDFNYDGIVNGLDFNILAAAFGTSLPPSLGRPGVAPPAEGPGGGMLRWGTGGTGSSIGGLSARSSPALPFSDTPVKGLFDLPGDAPMESLF